MENEDFGMKDTTDEDAAAVFWSLCKQGAARLGSSFKLSVSRKIIPGNDGGVSVWAVEASNSIGVVKIAAQDIKLHTALCSVLEGVEVKPVLFDETP